MATITKGSTISLSSSLPETKDQAGFEALDFTEFARIDEQSMRRICSMIAIAFISPNLIKALRQAEEERADIKRKMHFDQIEARREEVTAIDFQKNRLLPRHHQSRKGKGEKARARSQWRGK